MSPSISVQNVSVVYRNGNTALENVTFELQSGTICALVGMNGGGKSTLFKTIMGFLKPTQGEVRIRGETVAQARRHCAIAYVPQTEEVDWTFPVNVHDVVMMGRYGAMNFLRIPRARDRQVVEESLRRVEMWEYRDRQIGELSGGQKKRVFLARALAQEANIILLDEPFTGVDVKTESAIIALLRELRDRGCTILVSTHNLGSVPEFCDQAVIIKRRVIAFGATAEVFNEANLTEAFGGVLRHFQGPPSRRLGRVTVLTDDERPLVFGRDGKLQRNRSTDLTDLTDKEEKTP